MNNLGIFWPVPFLEISDQDWFHIFEVNVMGGVRLSRELLPSMLKRNWGRSSLSPVSQGCKSRPRCFITA